MQVLVINSGSSSIKYKVYNAEGGDFTPRAEGVAERIGIEGSVISHKREGESFPAISKPLSDHRAAIDRIMQILVDPKMGVLSEVSEITAVGHRVVHGGEDFTESARITPEVEAAIERNAALAPLHNPPNLLGIRAVSSQLPDVPQVAVFDTAVHQSMPAKAYLYGLPREEYETHGIRRYGFHGTSHGYVAAEAAEILERPLSEVSLITCHIGNGGSLAAFRGGHSVDTSMGLTPLEGVMMGTRSGDMDPYVPLHIQKTQGLSPDEVSHMLNKKGGLLGLTGKSDLRDVEDGYHNGDPACTEALEAYAYRIRKYIGAYTAVLSGADAVVFTAGVGENSPTVRRLVLQGFEYVGLSLDESANTRGDTWISTAGSRMAALVVPTDEEKVIARDTYRLAAGTA